MGTKTIDDTPQPDIACSCVKTARKYAPIPKGDAKDLIPNSSPQEGGLVLFYYAHSDTYHVAVILALLEDEMLVVEGNYVPCKETRRYVKYTDPAIRGFARF